ncbi:Sir2 family NAD-dependent protein deacetylase [Williamsia deligens]|uniref:NAD-dependent protein deacetylase n=1 Tax=Williamsia deligens TaxID=321325 RepID=A0ABW3GGT8_9NOCA|nr:Sir2 family NAD-dependent protein deacetylase [Williamsia deligens]MCP2195575.1 NAD-dependent protein deacetylase, SIR2 family [Williamsia deligens]
MRTRLQVAWTPGTPTDPDDDLPARIGQAHALLSGRRTVVLSGAGISTDSGIPDYRSPDAAPRTPMTIDAFLASPDFRRHYWARNHLGWRHMDAATPNAGHRAVTALQHRGLVSGVITQNVDMLHTKAGSRPVIELHGCYGRVCCLRCGWQISRHRLAAVLDPLNAAFTSRIRAGGAIDVAPDADVAVDDTGDFQMIDCPECGGALKPAIVYFGESVPRPVVDEAFAMVDDADALLVLGSSLTVMSGLRFVRHARRRGMPVVIVNRGVTRGDDCATLKIDHRCAEVLTGLVARIDAERSTGGDRSGGRDEIVSVHDRAS